MLHDLIRWMDDDLTSRLGQAWSPWEPFPRWASGRAELGWPVIDLDEHDDALVITADVPGLEEDDLEITVVGHALVIRGHRELAQDAGGRRRRFAGRFEHRFELADTLDVDHLDATLRSGVLTVRIPKLEAARPRRIGLGRVIDKVKGLLHSDDQEVKQAKDATPEPPGGAGG